MVANVFSPQARLGDRLLGFLGVRLVIFLLAARAFLPGVLTDPAYDIAYYHDEHGVILHEEAARIAIGDYQQVPAWNPFYCGGIVQIASAESNVLAPDFLLRVGYGTLPGRRLAVLLFVVLGMEGTFRYARRNGASALGASMAGVAYACSGYFVSLLGWGWIFMFNFNLVPWCAYAYEEGVRKRWWIVGGAAFMAWIVLGGGTYVAPYTAMVLALLAIHETARAALRLDGDRSVPWWRPGATLAATGALAVGLTAIRLLPMMSVLLAHGRPVEQKDQTSPFSVLAMLAVSHDHGGLASGAGDFYVGTWVFLLAALALLLADKRAAKMWVLVLIFGALACGEFIEDAPYLYMRKLPILSQLRFPVRMVMIAALFVAVAGALGLTRLEDLLPRLGDRVWASFSRLRERFGEIPPRALRVVVAVAAFAAAAWLAHFAAADVVDHDAIKPGQIYNMGPPLVYQDSFRQARGNRWDADVWPYANRGSLHCFEEQQLFESPYVRGDAAQEEYGAPDTDTKVERISWSPHKIVLRVKSSGPGRFLVNQNHHDAWQTDVGTLGSDGGLISVHVPPGEHVVTLTYSDRAIRFGALVSFATLLGIAIAAFKAVRRRVRRAAPAIQALP